ncbi:MAG: hypothetical protein SFU86_00050 [Pirellulaceae bacterium]|nr:hypothetical protein [Pirellulaceae bacterium]
MALEGCPRRTRLAPRVECHLLDWGDDSETVNQIDRGINAQESTIATENAAVAAQGAIAIGSGGAYQEAGSIGRDQNIEGGVSILTSDPQTVKAALDLVANLTAQTTAAATETNAASQFLAGQSVEALAAVREAEVAGGSALWRTVVMVLGIALAAVFAIKFWRKV